MHSAVTRRWSAMGSWFEAWLAGEDSQHLSAVASAVVDEVTRVETLLSRFNPASEISRINREAAHRPVQVDYELLQLLQSCQDWWRRTGGAFDIAAGGGNAQSARRRSTWAKVQLDIDRRTIRFAAPHVRLDLGGIGKGYALDTVGELLGRYGVCSALVHGGTSSVLAIGNDPRGMGWTVGLADPWQQRTEGSALAQLQLVDRAMSCSAVRHAGQETSDLVDPQTGQRLVEQAACIVLAAKAAEAEVLSTALLCMGKQAAQRYTEQELGREFDIGWIDRESGTSQLQWWTHERSNTA